VPNDYDYDNDDDDDDDDAVSRHHSTLMTLPRKKWCGF
jgi:hypothetical protein